MGDDIDIPVAAAVPISVTDQQQQHNQDIQDARFSNMEGRSSSVVLKDDSLDPSSNSVLTENTLHSLKSLGYTNGLIRAMQKNSQIFPIRIWVVDNSGSMATGDGHRIAESLNAKNVKLVNCSRWRELQQTVEYHSYMASVLEAPTVFRLLNDPGKMVGPQQFSIGERGKDLIHEDMQIATETITTASPSGCTPLSQHIVEIRENVMAMLPRLQTTGQKVAIILATDGLPTDDFGCCSSETRSEFESNLLSLADLPVWVVVRLCTDEESVVDYYNSLDSQLELRLEVLDDWIGESKEVNDFNPWLNYGLCLHRMREMGFHHRIFDLLDERRLNLDELKEFFFLLFGPDEFDGAPDPSLDLKGFLYRVNIAVKKEGQLWNPKTKKMGYWVDTKKLKSVYNDGCIVI